ncbi:polysaccharide biosynthesis/export protein [Azospirillaceae bacterium]
MQVFVWRNPDLSATVRVRPDGRISVPLIDDLPVSGKTPSEVARDLEEKLGEYVKDSKVTIIMVDFIGPMDRQIRVVGEAAKPQSVSYRRGMTVLDVMIASGGLTPFAAGNRATISRTINRQAVTYRVRLADLLKDGDLTANVEVAPGDVITVPLSWF